MSILKKSKTAKVVAGIIGFSMVLSLFAGVGVQTANAQALTASQLVELLISLGIIPADKAAAARAALSSSGSGSVGTSYTFTRNLTVGSTGEDVRQLQIVLNGDGVNIASSGAGSPGNETTYFGALTKAGVTRFQNKYAADVGNPSSNPSSNYPAGDYSSGHYSSNSRRVSIGFRRNTAISEPCSFIGRSDSIH